MSTQKGSADRPDLSTFVALPETPEPTDPAARFTADPVRTLCGKRRGESVQRNSPRLVRHRPRSISQARQEIIGATLDWAAAVAVPKQKQSHARTSKRR